MEFGLYVTPKKGRTVPRFGAPRGTYIGAKRVGKQLEWDEERIVGIPADEYRRFRAEYDGAIADGSLVRRSAEDFEKQREDRKVAKKRAAAEAAAEAEQAAKSADAEATEAQRVRAIQETAATIPAPTGERPKAFLLGGKDER